MSKNRDDHTHLLLCVGEHNGDKQMYFLLHISKHWQFGQYCSLEIAFWFVVDGLLELSEEHFYQVKPGLSDYANNPEKVSNKK